MNLEEKDWIVLKDFFVDSDNTFHITNFTTLIVALSSYQTTLLYALHSEM